VLLSGTLNDTTVARYRALCAGAAGQLDTALVLTDALGWAASALGLQNVEILRPDDIFLAAYGEKSKSRKIVPGNTDLVMLAFARRRPWYDHVWMVEYDVFFPQGFEPLLRIDAASDADLILSTGPHIRTGCPKWTWWKSFKPGKGAEDLPDAEAAYGLFCLSRYGAALFAALDRAYREGWTGHHEATVPTIARWAGLKVESVNAVARRAIATRVHSMTSFRVGSCEPTEGALIYHPVKSLEHEVELRRAIAEHAPVALPPDRHSKARAG
jgi:hypothetical protein